MTAIETTGLTKRFGDLVAVDGLDLTVREGEVFGFLGPNGAGKSTTINTLLGFLAPTSGSATVLGHDVRTESRALRRRIGVLPEGFAPYDRLTAREHVAYAAGLKDAATDPATVLERVGLGRDAWDRRAGGFSTGMCQRLALATALVGEPELLILDEPSSGLDPEGMAEMRELVREAAAGNTTVFFSSHILSEVEAVCDRVGMLVDGRLAAVGTIDELIDRTDTRHPLELSVADPPDGLGSELRAVEGVRRLTVEDGTIAAEVDHPARKVEVIRRADALAGVEDVVAERPSLETLFAAYASGGRSDPGAGRADR